jgi:signal transduction histidine kinase
MIYPQIPENEEERLIELFKYDILDSPRESEFDDLVKLASDICKAPISLITLVDTKRQWFKAAIGIGGDETERNHAFCAHAINQDNPMIVKDARTDERFHDNPFVTEDPNVRFYAGMPLITPNGHKLGTLCVIDTVPRELTEEQLFSLNVLSKQVMKLLELRLKLKDLGNAYVEIKNNNAKINRLNAVNARLLSIIGHDLRNSINNGLGLIELYTSGLLTLEEYGDNAAELKSVLTTSAELLTNLQKWGISQREGKILSLEKVSLDTLIEKVIKGQMAIAKMKNNELVVEGEKNVEVKTDPDMLEFVLRNLVQNSLKFTEGGRVSLKVKSTDDQVIIKVVDTGVGIAPSVSEKMFKWDSRQTTKGTNGEKGTGIGLLICSEFIQKLNGKMKVHSKVGEGTEIAIYLPRT